MDMAVSILSMRVVRSNLVPLEEISGGTAGGCHTSHLGGSLINLSFDFHSFS